MPLDMPSNRLVIIILFVLIFPQINRSIIIKSGRSVRMAKKQSDRYDRCPEVDTGNLESLPNEVPVAFYATIWYLYLVV